MMEELPLSGEHLPAHVCYLDGEQIASRGHHIIAHRLRSCESMTDRWGYGLFLQGNGAEWKKLDDWDTIPMGGRVWATPHCHA